MTAANFPPPLPLRQRKLDLFLVVAFGSFAMSTFTVDVWAVFGWMNGDDLLAQAFRPYTEGADPLFGAMPFYVWTLMLISLVFFGPMDVMVVIGLIRGWRFIRLPALIFAGSQITAMTTYFCFEALGPYPPLSWPTVIAANAPYLIVPGILAYRLRAEDPFAHAT